MTILDVKTLTDVGVAPDGGSVQLQVNDQAGQTSIINLPTDSLNSLIITLPGLLNRAMKLRHNDDTLRLVYSLGSYRLERAPTDDVYILSLSTPDHFTISFGVSVSAINEIAACVNEDVRSKDIDDDRDTIDPMARPRLN